jgi:hypothetical protein
MIDFNHTEKSTHNSENSEDITGRFCEAIDAAMVEANGKQTPRSYLGVSAIGYNCERKVQYAYANTAKDPGRDFNGVTLRKFGAGHYFEDDTAHLLKKAGFILKTEKANGDQFGFKTLAGKFAGHCDGVFVDGPTWVKYPALWEHKAVGNKSFNKHKKEPIAVANRVYAAQIALYQAYLDLADNPAVFTVRNTDTQELYFEMVPFNAPLAQEMSDRAVRIISATSAGEQMPRGFGTASNFECKHFCDYSARCWDGE